ncbi:MAG: substrate-binding domain-containing protein, partial [Actinomycetota bacterium]|nr:substrate-binding domain-containing protein [Actinomycetota bacterium]
MSHVYRRHTRLLVAALAFSLLAAACGGDDGGGASADEGGSETLSGEVTISGSSTVEPITALNAEIFSEQNPDLQISVDGPGTSDGFELFCQGKLEISDASRPIEAEEIKACKKEGVDFIEVKVAIDGLSVLTSPEFEGPACLDYKDMYALVGPESEGFANWSDANELAQEVGAGNAPYPDVP